MAVHGPYKNKVNAEGAASDFRERGLDATVYKTTSGWKVSVRRR